LLQQKTFGISQAENAPPLQKRKKQLIFVALHDVPLKKSRVANTATLPAEHYYLVPVTLFS
jgi:hypothetical protein